MRKINYDRFPSTNVDGVIYDGWQNIGGTLSVEIAKGRRVVAIDCYLGVRIDEIVDELASKIGGKIFCTSDFMKSQSDIENMTAQYITDDDLFGCLSPLKISDYFTQSSIEECNAFVEKEAGVVVIVGCGASYLVADSDLIVYADMARWEIQMRYRQGEKRGLGVDDSSMANSKCYKRGLFNDWQVCDRHKMTLYSKVDYWLDTTIANSPKLIDRDTFLGAMDFVAKRPFRVVPFFDPAPWGGNWMKEKFGLPENGSNYGWCFDCVPEENSLFITVDGVRFEMPSVNLVNTKSVELLGESVYGRFGANFPIRFDYLDTMGGGNLSVQVHPTTQYAQENFGIHYTQDESYYMVDVADDATVYLGLQNGVSGESMVDALKTAYKQNTEFDAGAYVNILPAKKHDHFLIPAGTIHCSGTNSVVLEISATPNLFTFKLWDWSRLGLDGKPRPINVDRGAAVIDSLRDRTFVDKYLANDITFISEGDGWFEERTGLHEREFIETRRHRFTKSAPHNTGGGVNVLCLVEGEQVTVASPVNSFEPYEIHFGETFIVPACVGDYTVTPSGDALGSECVTMKAYVRF